MKRKIFCVVMLIAITSGVNAQSPQFLFAPQSNTFSPLNPNASAVDSRVPLIQDLTTGDLKDLVIEISFYRQVHSALSSGSSTAESMMRRLSITAIEAQAIVSLIDDWKFRTRSHADLQRHEMCRFWRSESSGIDDVEKADQALQIYSDIEKAMDEQFFDLKELNNQIAHMVSAEAAAHMLIQIEHRQRSKIDGVGYINWPDAVRARGNILSEVSSVCGGLQ